MADNSWRPQNVFADVVAQEEKYKAQNWEDYVRKENHCSITAFIVDMDGREQKPEPLQTFQEGSWTDFPNQTAI